METLETVLIFLFGGLVGFVLPGLGLSKRWQSPIPAATTFLLSILNLFLVVLLFQVLGISLSFPSIFPALALVSIFSLYLGWGQSVQGLERKDWRTDRVFSILIFMIILEMLVRTSLWPLCGLDTSFRWGFLATQIYEKGHFNFYPPLSAHDFQQYQMVDAIPPLISICYYWIFECCSGVQLTATSLFITAQFALAVSLVFSAAKYMKNARAGIYASAIYCSSELAFWASGMGQETGMLTLSLLATFNLLLRARGRGRRPLIYLAAAATAVGMLSREYGGIILICGGIVMVCRRNKFRDLSLYLGLSFLLCGAWYVKTWLLTGNPFYSIRTISIFPVHERYSQLIDQYKNRPRWGFGPPMLVSTYTLLLAAIPITFGGAFTIAQFKRRPFFCFISILLISTWVLSVPQTSSWQYSLRALHPLVCFLSVGGGLAIVKLSKRKPLDYLLKYVVGIMLVLNFLNMSVYPSRVLSTPPGKLFDRLFRPDYRFSPHSLSKDIRGVVRRICQDEGFTVTFSSYHFVQLHRYDFQVVSHFSPDADIFFQRPANLEEALGELRKRKIKALMVPQSMKVDDDLLLLSIIRQNYKNQGTELVEIYQVD